MARLPARVKNQIPLSVVDSCAIAPGVREKLKPRLAEALGVSIQTLRRWEAPTKNQTGLPERDRLPMSI
jgi:hypothetical protein